MSDPLAKLIHGWATIGSPAHPDAIEAVMCARVRDTPTGFRVVDRDGNPLVRRDGKDFDLGDLHALVKKESPSLFKAPTPSPSPEEGEPVFNGQNPWASGSRNFTAQMTLENTSPKLAAKLKAEAGHVPHASLGPSTTSDKPAKVANPFRKATWNLTQQWQLQNRDPELAERLQSQAAREAR